MTRHTPGFMSLFTARLLVFFASASVLVLETLAARLLAPYIGVSLETFTGVIGTVLAGISVGSWLGGRLADRGDPSRLLGPIFVGHLPDWIRTPCHHPHPPHRAWSRGATRPQRHCLLDPPSAAGDDGARCNAWTRSPPPHGDRPMRELGLDSDAMQIITQDARTGLAQVPTDSVDVVIGDAFSGTSVPWHLTTIEFVRALADRLSYTLVSPRVITTVTITGPSVDDFVGSGQPLTDDYAPVDQMIDKP